MGDSIACVGAPAKEGGNMVKVHIHANKPDEVFDVRQD
jgi:dihydroxyacetone kinase-like predicted kinase